MSTVLEFVKFRSRSALSALVLAVTAVLFLQVVQNSVEVFERLAIDNIVVFLVPHELLDFFLDSFGPECVKTAVCCHFFT